MLKRLNQLEVRNIPKDSNKKSYHAIEWEKQLNESKPFCFLSVFPLSMENIQYFVLQDCHKNLKENGKMSSVFCCALGQLLLHAKKKKKNELTPKF